MVSNSTYNMIEYFGNDLKRINHTLKVLGYAATIGGIEGLNPEKLLVVQLSAIMHDIGIKESERKYGTSEAKYQELEGPPVARRLLADAGAGEEEIQRVCFIVGHHHTYSKIDDIDFQIIVEADFLVNLDEGHTETGVIKTVKQKYFKTRAGTRILESMFNV